MVRPQSTELVSLKIKFDLSFQQVAVDIFASDVTFDPIDEMYSSELHE